MEEVYYLSQWQVGGKVTGIDASKKISILQKHAFKNNLKINYLMLLSRKIKIKKKYDVILNMEVVEHVDDLNFL